jgi:hypothetical protein
MTPEQIVQANKKQLSKLSWKVAENHSLADAIKEFFDDNDLDLIRYRKDGGSAINQAAKMEVQQRMIRMASGSDDFAQMAKTYQERTEQSEDLEQLGRAYYILKGGNKSVVAKFESGGVVQPMLMAHWYSKHKLCNVWNFRKSQIIRKRYRNYLQNALMTDKHGNPQLDDQGKEMFLMRKCQPVHMVLTLQHKDGMYDGKRFYARKLLEAFRELRRSAKWKRNVYAGEYGLEIKRGKKSNGLHIHVHSLVFVLPGISIEEMKTWLRRKWKDLTDSYMVHFETLYYYKRDDSGRWIMEQARQKKSGKWEYQEDIIVQKNRRRQVISVEAKPVMRRKKFYIDPENSTIDEYMKGIMECIKYHFKSDGFKTNKAWDVPLIMDVLNNSKNLRFYSRFGAFYNTAELNFDFKEDDPEDDITTDLDSDDLDEELKSKAVKEIDVINPFTLQPAEPGEYQICVVSPESLIYKKTSRGDPDLYNYDPDEFREVAPLFSMQQVLRSLCTGKLYEVLQHNHKPIF